MNNQEKRVVTGQFILMFLISVGEGLVNPLMPLFATDLGARYSELGYLAACYSVIFVIFTLISGKLSDLFDRKMIILAGVLVNVIASTCYYLAGSFVLLLVGKGLEGMGRGLVWPAANSLISDQTGEKVRAKIMGYYVSSYGGGVAVGTLLGGFVAQNSEFKTVFAAYPLLSVVAILLFAIFTSGISTKSKKESNVKQKRNGLTIGTKISPVCFIGFAFAGFLWTAWSLLSRIGQIYGFSITDMGVVYSLLWVSRIIAFIPSGHIAARIGRGTSTAFGMGCCLVASVLFTLSTNYAVFIIGVILGGIGTGLVYPNCINEVAAQIPKVSLGLGMGLLETSIGIGYGIQPLLAGVIGDLLGVHYTFLPAIIISLLAVLVAYQMKKREHLLAIKQLKTGGQPLENR